MWMRNTTEEKKLFSMPIICKKKKKVLIDKHTIVKL